MKGREARLFAGTEKNLSFLARRLLAGELVGVPTETVYGLAANAFDARACQRIFRAKGRPSSDPLIVHIHSLAQLDDLCEANDVARHLARGFWPGGLTMVLPRKKAVPDVVTAGRESVAVRMPAHRLFRRLLKRVGVPLAAPSANRFGYISPTTAEHVRDGLGGRIRYILDGGPARIGLESTIIDLRDPARPTILRPGAVTADELEQHLGQRLKVRKRRALTPATGQVAPGMLARHYSPRTRVKLHHRLPAPTANDASAMDAFVYLQRPPGPLPRNVFWLDAKGELAGAARRLFAVLRRIDAMKFRCLHLERAPNHGLGLAINDRLKRAAAR